MLTIATLFSGRWYTLDPYLCGLENIDQDKKKINLVWVSNADKRFVDMLKRLKKELEPKYNSIKLYHSDLNLSQNALCENGPRAFEHAIVIAKLYNMAWDKIKDEDVLFLEDDICAPSNAYTGLKKYLSNKVPYVSGSVFCRHQNIPFVWDLKWNPKGYSYTDSKSYDSYRPRYMYGVQEIGCAHFGLTLLNKTVIDKIKKPIFKPQYSKKGAKHFTGCDIVLCLQLEDMGKKRIQNWDVRGLHYDSKGIPH